jgi:small conductance mechanosensitive channel
MTQERGTALKSEDSVDNIDQLFNPESNSFWNLLLAAGVIVVSIVIARSLRRRSRAVMGANNIDESAASLLARIAGWTVIFLGAVLALSIMGVDMVPLVLVGALVLAFFFFSGKSLLENWAAGLLLQARGPYKIGDRVDTEGYSGFVQETNTRTVVLRTGDGQIVHIPNVDVLTSPLVNRTGEEDLRRTSLTFGVADDSDFEEVERLLVDAATVTQGVSVDPNAPTAWIASVGETTVNIEVRFWHLYADRHAVRSTVTSRAIAALADAGITMPYPTRKVIVSRPTDPQESSAP